MLWRISFRNLWRHRSKSLVVGLILFIGSFVMTLGSATLTKMNASIREGMVERFIGDITIMSSEIENQEVLFQLFNQPVVLANYLDVEKVLLKNTQVDKILPYANHFFLLLTDHDNPLNQPNGIFVMGADLHAYEQMFGNVNMLEGRVATNKGERGIYLTDYIRGLYYQFYERLYAPQGFELNKSILPEPIRALPESELIRADSLILMGVSDQSSTLDVRVPIKGVFRYEKLHGFWKEVCILDIESYRECMNYTTGESVSAELTEGQAYLLEISEEEVESMFFEEEAISSFSPSTQRRSVDKLLDKEKTPSPVEIDVDEGAYELVAVTLKDPTKKAQTIDELNKAFKKKALKAQAVSWDTAARGIAIFVVAIKWALFIVVMLVFSVAIIIIMNSLSMAVLERSNEIAMMRAIGTHRPFIVKMIGAETICLTALFGGWGILCGGFFSYGIGLFEISSQNEFVQLIMGGEVYKPQLTYSDVLLGVIQLIMVAALSMLYPAMVARKDHTA